jgi:sugar/nucleoside kinase (ribokinase family)
VVAARHPPRVLVVGGASWNTIIDVDHFPEPGPATIFPRSWHEAVGSSGAGKALNLVRLGADVTLVTALGDDELGDRVAANLISAGISLLRVRNPGGTTRHVNLNDGAGGRISFILDHPTAPELDLPRVEQEMRAADLVYLGAGDVGRSLTAVARRQDRPIWTDLHGYDGTDPSFEGLIEAAEVVLFSTERLRDPRTTMQRLHDRGKRLVVCTLAERGALALTTDGRWIDVPAEHVDVVDTNGAGDAFAAGLMVAESLGLPIYDALAVGARAASISIGSTELASSDLSLARVLPRG